MALSLSIKNMDPIKAFTVKTQKTVNTRTFSGILCYGFVIVLEAEIQSVQQNCKAASNN